ncbi:MAG: group II intron reverse transcriptase/maturase, partial [Moorea sp. SIO2I5]|nr:group II intron reverse transcriptase/maturase [Moorena sp. SIO2I5]
ISPLLANIALHGLEEKLGIKYRWDRDKRRKAGGFWTNTTSRTYVRFADDFVVLTESKEDAEEAKTIIEEWLSKKGLTLSEDKTKISHLSTGFNFLGWNFRKYQTTTKKTGLITLIKPNQKSIKKIKGKLREEIKKRRSAPQTNMIKGLNPIIKGWSSYHSGAVSKEIFSELDEYVYWKMQRWGRRKHPKKSREWISKKYFGKKCPGRDDKWIFGDYNSYLNKFAWTPIERHTLVSHDNSPDHPGLIEYWEERKRKLSEKTARNRLSAGRDKIANRQGYKCPVCQQNLGDYNNTHLHHIIPKQLGGLDKYDNLIYLHSDCHHSIHALGATKPEIQKILKDGVKTPTKNRNKSQKVQTRKSKKRGCKENMS